MDVGCEGRIFLVVIASVDVCHLGKGTLILVDRMSRMKIVPVGSEEERLEGESLN